MSYRKIWLGLVLLALVVSGCDQSSTVAAARGRVAVGLGTIAAGTYVSNGERIYLTGTSANDIITYSWAEGFAGGMMGGRGMMGEQGMMQLSCADCHGPNGRGSQVVLAMTEIDAPDIRWSTLTQPGQMDHPPYTEETFERAVTQGLDPGGSPLDPTMPRWQMSEQDLADLITFLKTLD